jgi:molybdopterin-guanine dinucleotide biosynthesis protein A
VRDQAGFVLAGGNSTRMGRDKALLPHGGGTLLEHICRVVAEAAGCVAVIGPQGRYGHVGFEVIPDLEPGLGPLGGIHTALSLQRARWNLVVACDMPRLGLATLTDLVRRAKDSEADCLMPVTSDGPQPLCAMYRGRCLVPVEQALAEGVRKISTALERVVVEHLHLSDTTSFMNLNTPEDWESLTR